MMVTILYVSYVHCTETENNKPSVWSQIAVKCSVLSLLACCDISSCTICFLASCSGNGTYSRLTNLRRAASSISCGLQRLPENCAAISTLTTEIMTHPLYQICHSGICHSSQSLSNSMSLRVQSAQPQAASVPAELARCTICSRSSRQELAQPASIN